MVSFQRTGSQDHFNGLRPCSIQLVIEGHQRIRLSDLRPYPLIRAMVKGCSWRTGINLTAILSQKFPQLQVSETKPSDWLRSFRLKDFRLQDYLFGA